MKDASAKHFREAVEAACKSNVGETHTEPLRYRAKSQDPAEESDGAKEDTTPFIRLNSWSLADGRYSFVYQHGRRGSHETAMAAQAEDDTPLNDKAPANQFRAWLYIPETGEAAVFVAECRNNYCPGEDLLRLVGVGTKEIASEAGEDLWWRFVPKRVSDELQLTRWIKNGAASYVELIKHSVSSSGRRSKKLVRLRQDGLPVSKKQAMAKALTTTWTGINPEDVGADTKVPKGSTHIQQVAALMDAKPKAGYFDDAGIGWEGPDGSTQFFSPTTLGNPFTYHVGRPGVRPRDNEMIADIESNLRQLMVPLKVQLKL